jgi:hypothetical protein
MVPSIKRIALLMNPDNANAPAEQADAEAGAPKLGHETVVFNAQRGGNRGFFRGASSRKVQMLLSLRATRLLDRREQIAVLAERNGNGASSSRV